MNEIFEKIYNDNNTDLNESSALFEKVYTEAEMLNEMNPKLRALLAAGLIGTAGLGAVSCSMPADDYTEDTKEMNTAEETTDTTFKAFELEVTPEQAKSLARAVKDDEQKSLIKDISKYTDLIYKDGFGSIEFNTSDEYDDGQTYIRYIDVSDKVIFYIPIDMESDFDAAIAAYKATYAE